MHPGPIYDGALASPRSLIARDEDGRAHALPLRRWLDAADDVDARLLADVEGPVLDLGCGPGRHLRHLAAAGVTAEGVDRSAAAVAIARADGLRVHRRDALDAPPRPGHWSTVLLLDGNIGIGGDPSRLLRRAAQALIPAGQVVVELAAARGGLRTWRLRLEAGHAVGDWFGWVSVGGHAIAAVAFAAGLRTVRRRSDRDRHFAWLALR